MPCILVCGGGNGAHCLAGIAASHPDSEVRILTLFSDEAERWSKILAENDFVITINNNNGETSEIKSKPSLVTKDPSACVPGANVIFLTVPAFAHEQYFRAISQYVDDNTLIVGLPGQAGFEFQCLNILGNKVKKCAVVSSETLPWACRILEFGKLTQILGYKEILGAALLQGSNCNLPKPALETIQYILGEKPKIKQIQNYIAVNLMAKSIIHPPLLYGKWYNWDGQPLEQKPLFYQGVDERQADLLSKVSDEVVATAMGIQKLRSDMDMSQVIHIFDWFKEYYRDQISDTSCLMKSMQTNKAYDGLLHPMKVTEDGRFVPDFTYRYTAEDIPYGLVIMKGIAQITNVPTPIIDEIITWAQTKLNKEYIIGSELKGKDVSSTRAPQSYGFTTLDDLFNV